MKSKTRYTATAFTAGLAGVLIGSTANTMLTPSPTTTTPQPPPQPETAGATSAPIPLGEIKEPTMLALIGYDADGETVMEFWDYHPEALDEISGSGPGDSDRTGTVDLADLNLVLANMGREY